MSEQSDIEAIRARMKQACAARASEPDGIPTCTPVQQAVIDGADTASLLVDEYGQPSLNCSNCRGSYIHLSRVGTLVGRDEYEAVPAIAGTQPVGLTPSRRSALQIVFWCEECHTESAIVIQQHKGNEFLEFRVPATDDKATLDERLATLRSPQT